MNWLKTLLQRFSRKGPFSEPPPSRDDEKTLIIPTCGNPALLGMDFYAVYEAFLRERLKFQNAIRCGLRIEHALSPTAGTCELGAWLQVVHYPARPDLIDQLRTLHEEWHSHALRIARVAELGNHAAAIRMLREGRFTILSGQIANLLSDLWHDASLLKEAA